jgi:hypothetical protein
MKEGLQKQTPNAGIFKYDPNQDAPPTLVPVVGFSGTLIKNSMQY